MLSTACIGTAIASSLHLRKTLGPGASLFDSSHPVHRLTLFLSSRANSIDDPLARGQRQVETAKMRMGMQIDDAHFRNLLLETQVLNTKEHTRWGFEILTELLEGPLLAPKRLDEAMRASKFMRRLLSFFHPFSYRYSDTRRSTVSPCSRAADSD